MRRDFPIGETDLSLLSGLTNVIKKQRLSIGVLDRDVSNLETPSIDNDYSPPYHMVY